METCMIEKYPCRELTRSHKIPTLSLSDKYKSPFLNFYNMMPFLLLSVLFWKDSRFL